METSWQNKCSSSWSSLPPSSQHPQQGAPNQTEKIASSFIHPFITQEASSMGCSVVRKPVGFNSLNLGSCRSGKPELGHSFLSLLSGPSSQLHHGIQPVPFSTLPMDTTIKLPVQNSNRVFGGDNYGAPLATVGLLSPQLGNNTMRTGPEHFLVVPSHAASTSSNSRFPDLHGIHQMANGTCNSEINQIGLNSIVRVDELGTDSLYPRQGWVSSSNLADGLHSTTHIQASLKVPPVTVSAASVPASTFGKGRPRVFCLATNGELLLNSNGLLGVVCLCHGLQMSIAKYCEHSGSCIVNPGDAVRLESGEPLSQWRRLYFPKYGLRVPDDNSGWDWPEKNQQTVDLVNCKATVPTISKSSDMFKVVDPLIASTQSGQLWKNFVSPNNSHTGGSVRGNTFGDVNVRQRNAQEGCSIPLKSVAGTAQNISPIPADIRTTHMVKGGPRSNGSENTRQGSGYHSISDYIGYLTKGGDPLIASQSLENFKFLGAESDVRRANNSKDASSITKDGTSSNIELRLGQPSQQSYNLEGPVISAMQPQPFMYNDSNNSLLHGPRLHNVVIPKENEESRQHFHHVSSNTTSSPRWDESKLIFTQIAPRDAANVEQFKGCMAKSSHVYFTHSSTLSERDVMPRATNNMINYSGTSMSSALFGESHGTNSSDFPRNKSDGTQTQLNSNTLCHPNCMDKGKRHIADNGSYATEKVNTLIHNNQMAGLSPFLGVFSNNHLPSGTNVNGNQSSHSSRALQNASDISNQSSSPGKDIFFRGSNLFDHAPPRPTTSSTMISGPDLPLSELSTGFSLTNSTCRPSLMRLLSNKESVALSPHFMNENLRLLAPRHTFDPSKRKCAIIPNDMGRAHETVYNPLTVEKQQGDSALCSVASEERKDRPYLTPINNQLKTCSSRYVDGDFGKLAGATDVKDWFSFSTSSRGMSFLSKEHGIDHPPSHDSVRDLQALRSLGRIEDTTMTSGEHDECSQNQNRPIFTGNCSCAIHSSCFGGYCCSRGDTPDTASMAHFKRIIGNTSTPVPSNFNTDHLVQENRPRNCSEKVDDKIPARINCYASQWRDVPRKCIGFGNAIHTERSTQLLNASNNESQVVETSSKRFDGTHVVESLNEQQMSNVYSGCSAPALTMGSCTVDAENDRYINEHVVDEGSGIERCWSSDDTFDSERSTKTTNVYHKLNSVKGGKWSSNLPSLSSDSRADNPKLRGSFGQKKVHKRFPAGSSVHESINKAQPSEVDFKNGKRKKTIKWKRLDVSFPTCGLSSVQYDSPQTIGDTESHSCSSRGTGIRFKHNHDLTRTCGVYSNQTSGLKRKHSTLLSDNILSRKRDLCELVEHKRERENFCRKELQDDMNHLKISKSSSEKKSKQRWAPDVRSQFSSQDVNHTDAGKAAEYNSNNCAKRFSCNQVVTCDNKTKPVVCGKYGIISNGELVEGLMKPAKIIPLSTILKTARICSTIEAAVPKFISAIATKKRCFRRSSKCSDKLSVLEDEVENSEDNNNVSKNKEDAEISIFKTKKVCFSEDGVSGAELSIPGKEEHDAGGRILNHNTLYPVAPLKSRFKEARKRSLSQLAGRGKDVRCSSRLPPKARSTSISHGKPSLKKVDGGSKVHRGELSQNTSIKSVKQQKGEAFILDPEASCCVCGSSKKDGNNCLLECSSCLIRVHQACYGVSRVPNGRWCCRPCRANSKDNVCVLCGYVGGAMTQALKSRNIVKGLLEAWSSTSESKKFSPSSETSVDDMRLSETSGSEYEHGANSVTSPVAEESPTAMLNRDSLDKIDVTLTLIDTPSNLQVHNSITAGVVDKTAKQWVHMVCGLWTPETRCPNVDTMNAFDVSGVSSPLKNEVCSMCNRSGGSCIKCRVVNCSVQFHPWCAHQKGLLQSEVEGVDNDMVGFYGRCVLHATHGTDSVVHPVDTNLDTLGREEFTCARTEGYKGRKKDGFRHKPHEGSTVNGECLVPQEQIDAWLHINGQKSCVRGAFKPQISDIEYDCRKEYGRYKQARGWKNLVVYKSGIHGLGLYTSQFISRGAMVVEYIGEIVGVRVSDKREIEYQSGRKLQYKSACYFFRIDKEHIIDATRKGGIARFVNHSCMPNCVAKVISVRNEKKVVFFAERDIYPGEEVTYDYHFNHEDEGEKILCFCNSKNCRRFLN